MSAGEVHVLLLAAGRSSRTGASHKLLSTFDGEPLIRRSARIALESEASGVTVVTGYRAEAMTEALRGLPVKIVHNPRFAEGLSTSLITGFRSAPESAGILVMLADQPLLRSNDLNRLIRAFRENGPDALVVACDGTRRFNPVVISRLYDAEIIALSGDVGARRILAAHPDRVREVEIGKPASFDVDTVDALVAAGGVPEAVDP